LVVAPLVAVRVGHRATRDRGPVCLVIVVESAR
jgi:hypothetical protein